MTMLAASPNCFLEFSPMVAYRYFADLGLRYVEVPASPGGLAPFVPELMGDEGVKAFHGRLTSMGLQAICVGAYCDLLTPPQVEALRRRIDFAQQLGALNVVSDATRKLEVDTDEWRKIVNALRYLGDYAGDRGVKIALETHGGLTRNGALCKKLLDAVDHPAVGVNYDTGNIYYYNDDLDPAEDVKQIAEKIVQVHLKDTIGGKGEWLFCDLGEGRVNFPAVVKSLKAAGFDGPYSLELEGKRGEDLNRGQNAAVVGRALDYLRGIGLVDEGARKGTIRKSGSQGEESGD